MGGVFPYWRGVAKERHMLPCDQSPLLEEHSVHGEAQHCKHSGPDARSEPEVGALQVSLGHVSVPRRERVKQKYVTDTTFTAGQEPNKQRNRRVLSTMCRSSNQLHQINQLVKTATVRRPTVPPPQSKLATLLAYKTKQMIPPQSATGARRAQAHARGKAKKVDHTSRRERGERWRPPVGGVRGGAATRLCERHSAQSHGDTEDAAWRYPGGEEGAIDGITYAESYMYRRLMHY